ncbi:MAG: hypothetical protein HYX66_09080 [Ignavibacteria bacterium]|nr:hypothetical protein [Ignavibacteria bacterium]
MRNKNSLNGALKTILVSCSMAMIITVVTALYTGETLFLVASALFAISGTVGVFVVKSLSRKIGQGR